MRSVPPRYGMVWELKYQIKMTNNVVRRVRRKLKKEGLRVFTKMPGAF